MVRTMFKWSLVVLLFCKALSPFSVESAQLPAAKFHPFYVSVTEINHNKSEGSLEISCKMYADDFENTLKNQFKTKIDFSQPKDIKQLHEQVFAYIRKNLQLTINGKAAELEFVGFEKESESAWCYLQVSHVLSLKSLEIRNTLLYESYDSQIGIMHILSNNERKTTKLTNPESKAVFTF